MIFTYNLVWMIRRFFTRIGQNISDFVQHPIRVFLTCLIFVSAGLLLDGTLIRLWRLNRDSHEIAARISNLQVETMKVDHELRQTRDPNFLELQARDRLDLANKGDLVFVFSDN